MLDWEFLDMMDSFFNYYQIILYFSDDHGLVSIVDKDKKSYLAITTSYEESWFSNPFPEKFWTFSLKELKL